ncbi:MAG: regulatory protein GemA [Ramlibacter sp.]|nr:regulatory protein GemA [Ramlibacter sp.]MCW5650536.1 regulatory protein GemA [Ramlibacter sp.]
MMANHVAAIHVLKGQLKLSDDDYRALLRSITGRASCSEMSATQQQAVRDHMARLAQAMGQARAPAGGRRPRLNAQAFARVKAAASPRERKVWALWLQLGRDGLVTDTSHRALNAWVQRQVGVSALGFANGAQLDALIEALKRWGERHHG